MSFEAVFTDAIRQLHQLPRTTADEKYAVNEALDALEESTKTTIRDWIRSIDATPEQNAYVDNLISQVETVIKAATIEIDRREWGQNISMRSADPIQQVAYGFCRIGGNEFFCTGDQGEEGQWKHTFITYAAHEIWKVTDLFLDGRKVDFPADVDGEGRRVFGWASSGTQWEWLVFLSALCRGTADQVADPHLVSQSNILFPGKWTEAHRQRGHAGFYLITKYDGIVFINGDPEVAIEGYWKNDIYDFRTETRGYTNNWALCFADYLMNSKFGPGYTLDDFDVDNMCDAADVSDEDVALKAGGTEKRYTINGAFRVSSANDHDRMIEAFKQAGAADAHYTGGKWRFYPGKWRAPTVTLTAKNLRSAIKLQTKPSKRDVINGVKGKYRSPETLWELTDYPVVKNDMYREQDGEELWLEEDAPFTTSPSAVQRIKKVRLEEARQWMTLEADFDMAAYPLFPGETVNFEYERYGFTPKVWKVLERQRKSGQSPGSTVIGLVLKETAAGVHDWNEGEETTVDLAPNTTLPDPSFVLPPKNLVLTSGTTVLDVRADGTVFSRIKVVWDQSKDPFVLSGGMHHIQYKKSAESDYRTAGFCLGRESTFYILDVADGELYDVRVQALNPIYGSPWTYELGHPVLGKTENPTTPTDFVVTVVGDRIRGTWSLISDLDALGYEVRVGGSWATGTRIYYDAGNSFTWDTQAAGNYTFWLRAIDRSKNYSFDSAVATLQITPPGIVSNFTGGTTNNIVRLNWETPSAGSFPIGGYNIYRGATFESADFLGGVKATFFPIPEQTAGTYTYWVTAVDTYGNEGEPVSVQLKVDAPPLFVLLYDQLLDPAAAETLTNAVPEGSTVIMPVVTGQTYSEHFTENSWDTPQDQIDAGYPLFVQPANTAEAIYEQIVDYGEEISGALITVQDFSAWVDGSGAVDFTLSYSADGSSWTDASAYQVYGSSFRYVKTRWAVTGTDDTSLYRVVARLRLEVKKVTLRKVVAASSGDASGTLVEFTETVLDVQEDSVTSSYKGSSAYFVGHTISGNDIRVFLWNTSGTRVSGDVVVVAEVVIAE